MKRSYSSGSAVSRWSFDHHQAKKPSIWSEAIARPHLIVAALGTIALVGLSGTAIWMALPDAAMPALAVKVQPVPAAPVMAATSEIADASTERISEQPPTPAAPSANATVPTSVVAPAPVLKVDASNISIAVAKDAVAPLEPQSPRWIDPDAGPAKRVEVASSDSQATQSDGDDLENAYADDASGSVKDADSTAAIPNFKPDDKAQTGAPDGGSAASQVASAATGTGRIIRSVTMRAKPSSRGGVIGTVPAKTQVQVVSCSQWCEIVYNGKRGFIYKSFMARGAR